ncbi:hypothetical protein BDV96DRAFT_604388 [Lophiotrema nucula]|uniref:Maintenance of telomere capping protein 6 n=1 Tax=Lophiotrema nucula TaxID=690887 RepID=A0A6A5YT47_9PLEO|nr:hypothetical protein BDV96DRAFT_604388 [Lophiotrema nucula]
MSDSLYNPDDGALLIQPWDEAFRAQRDVGLRIPLNYLTVPAISLQGACFAHNQYENKAFQKCISNLLASGFRRYLVDVYWDPGRNVWSLCPAQLPPGDADSDQEQSPSVLTVSSSVYADRRGIEQTKATLWPTALSNWEGILWPRQDDVSSSSEAASSIATSTTPSIPVSTGASTLTSSNIRSSPSPVTTSAPLPSFLTFPTDYDAPLVEVGSYNCTILMTLDFLTGILEDFMSDTDTTTDASVNYFFISVHAAASYNTPSTPAQQPPSDQLPGEGNLLSDIVKGNLSSVLFTPSDLQGERNNLNDSWYDVHLDDLPLLGYYTTSTNSDGNEVSDDGWPSEAYAEFKKFWRLVASFLDVDPQMSGYNLSADFDTIFPPDEIRLLHNVTISPSGGVTSGCLFKPSDVTITPDTNSSWAVGLIPSVNIGRNPDTTIPIASVANLTQCGISPFINSSISNVTADEDPTPYLAYTHSTLWSWLPGEPLNTTDASSDNYVSKCTVMTTDSPYPGRWKTADCQTRNRVACQHTEQPYNWTISTTEMDYFDGESGCPSPYTFSVPHTAIENQHLLSVLQNPSAQPSGSFSNGPIFVNLNSIDIAGCWVTSINGTCPYVPRTDSNRTRIVVIPTVAAVIICVLAALTFFVKCAANRREGHRARRRRNVGGWDYEGVPS